MAAVSKKCFGANPNTERGTAGKIDVSSDGNWLCYGNGKSVILRDVRKPTICDAYTDHTRNVTVARFSPSGGYVASADVGGLVRMWSPAHPEKMLKKETPCLAGPILDLAWDFESKRIVVGGDGGKSFPGKVFTAETGSALGEITGHQKPITCVAFRPGKPMTLATGSQDFKVGFFAGPPFKFVKSASEHTNFVQCVRYSPDGKFLCSVGMDKQIFLMNGENGDAIKALAGETEHAGGSIYGCVFSPDSKKLLTVSGDKTCKIWDVETSAVVETFSVGSNTDDMQVACAWTQGAAPVSLSLNGDINYLDVGKGAVAQVIKSYNSEPVSLACDWKGDKSVYVGDHNGKCTRFSPEGSGEHLLGKGHEGQVSAVVARAGKVSSAGFDDSVRSIEGAEFKGGVAQPGGQPSGLSICANDPTLVAFVCTGKAGIIKDGRIEGSVVLDFEGQGVAISPNGDKLIIGNKGKKSCIVYDVKDGGSTITKSDKVLPELVAPANVIAYSPDGKYIAVGDAAKEVSLWDGASFAPLVRDKWVFHTSVINSLAFSPDSLYLATGSNDSQVYIWNPASEMKKTKLAFAHKGGVTGVDWISPTELVTCGADRCVRTWVPTLPHA